MEDGEVFNADPRRELVVDNAIHYRRCDGTHNDFQ